MYFFCICKHQNAKLYDEYGAREDMREEEKREASIYPSGITHVHRGRKHYGEIVTYFWYLLVQVWGREERRGLIILGCFYIY